MNDNHFTFLKDLREEFQSGWFGGHEPRHRILKQKIKHCMQSDGRWPNFTKNLRKSRNGAPPNKLVVALCLIVVVIALIFAYLKIVFKIF